MKQKGKQVASFTVFGWARLWGHFKLFNPFKPLMLSTMTNKARWESFPASLALGWPRDLWHANHACYPFWPLLHGKTFQNSWRAGKGILLIYYGRIVFLCRILDQNVEWYKQNTLILNALVGWGNSLIAGMGKEGNRVLFITAACFFLLSLVNWTRIVYVCEFLCTLSSFINTS